MIYAIIENGTVVNAIVADEAFAAQIGAILLPDGIRIGDLYVDGEFVRVEQDEPETEHGNQIEPISENQDNDRISSLETEIAQLRVLLEQLASK